MYSLHYGNQSYEFVLLDDALEAAKTLVVEWIIFDSQGKIVFDYIDRVGP